MLSPCPHRVRPPRALLLCLLLWTGGALAQEAPPSPPANNQTPDDVLRINTELVQTDVMVFDKEGRFVDNLQREQFELRIDDRSQAISFFDRVQAGSADEEAQLAAARGLVSSATEKNPPTVRPLDRGRIIIFFIDDLHLTFESLRRARQTLLSFINGQMGQNDQIAITSTSGQIGFLQQLTDNKMVLRAAIERLNLQPQLIRDTGQPPMTEYLALAIIARHDRDVLNYYVEPLLRQQIPQSVAEEMVRSRAQQILQHSQHLTRNTLYSLDNLARTISPLPGRKLVFFMSDGFLLNTNESDVFDKLSTITNVAARNGVVIYTMDTRGLSVNQTFSAATATPFDPTGRITNASLGENTASQEALRVLAGNTGGRALLNTNALDAAVNKTLKETSTYYLIAWRPETEEQKGGKLHHIEVKIKNRSDLQVQVRRGFLSATKEQAAKGASPVEKRSGKVLTPTEELRAAINSFYPSGTLPMALAVDYLDAPEAGAALNVSMEVPVSALSFTASEGKHRAALDLEGHVYNDRGQVGASFQDHLNVTTDSAEAARQKERAVYYTHQIRLSPGLYQVRIAARDAKSGRTGAATQWIEVPDLKSRTLALSSLLVGESKQDDAAAATGTSSNETQPVATAQLDVARSFARSSRLRFLLFIYNASRGAAGTTAPDVAIQVQVLRDDQPILTTALRKVSTEGVTDLARLPYAAEIPLDKMLAGRYLLHVTVIDRLAKKSASQQLRFAVE